MGRASRGGPRLSGRDFNDEIRLRHPGLVGRGDHGLAAARQRGEKRRTPLRVELAEDVVEEEQGRTAVELGEQVELGELEGQDRGALLAARGEPGQVASGQVEAAIPTNASGSHMVAVTADGKRAWTTNVGDGTVSELDIAGRKYVTTMPVAGRNEGIAVTPDGALVWAGSNVAKTVSVVDTKASAITKSYPGFGFPYRMAVTPDGKTAIVCDPELSKIHFYDVATLNETGVLDVPPDSVEATTEFAGQAAPEGFIVSRDGKTMYIALQGSSRVAEIDILSRKITGRMMTGGSPDGIGYSQLTAKR